MNSYLNSSLKLMRSPSRREFLSSAICLSLTSLLPRRIFPSDAKNSRDLQLLVVGDSLIWGQGLEEKDKFYTLVKNWLETEAFGSPRNVSMKLKAHSGSTLKFHPDEEEAHRKANRDETFQYKPEVNVAFPSIWKQVEVAADEYAKEGNGGADLVMLTGSITDISVAGILDPFGKDDLLRDEIRKYCFQHMFDVLELIAAKFPDSTIAVIGYYPMISPKTPSSKLYNVWLESSEFPRPLKPLANNVLTRQFLGSVRKKALKRSRIWAEDSVRHLTAAVDRLNEKAGKPQAIFIPSPITEDTAYETPNTLLFRLMKKGRTEDPLFESRSAECRASLAELKSSTGLKYSVRMCEIAAVGHPNPAGSRAYAEVIEKALRPLVLRP